MRIAYVVPGAPGSTAFTPIPCINGSALAYKSAVTGQPGTQGIPAPWPGTFDDIVPWAYAGGFSESKAMPQVWYPNLYYQATLEIPGSDPVPVRIFSDNQMPVPAADPRGRAAVLAGAPKFMGQRQVEARKAIPRWPDWLPRPGFGG
jgi:hypothetical protein